MPNISSTLTHTCVNKTDFYYGTATSRYVYSSSGSYEPAVQNEFTTETRLPDSACFFEFRWPFSRTRSVCRHANIAQLRLEEQMS